jgi:hypothetical protein
MKPEMLLDLLKTLSDTLDDAENVEDDHARTAARAWVAAVTTMATHARGEAVVTTAPETTQAQPRS